MLRARAASSIHNPRGDDWIAAARAMTLWWWLWAIGHPLRNDLVGPPEPGHGRILISPRMPHALRSRPQEGRRYPDERGKGPQTGGPAFHHLARHPARGLLCDL